VDVGVEVGAVEVPAKNVHRARLSRPVLVVRRGAPA
jgi:hypothetical protein